MKHLLIAVCLTALVAAPALRADEPKSDRAAVAKEIREGYAKEVQEYSKAVREAKTPEERQEALKKQPKPAEYLAKAQKLVEENAKDEAGLDALVFIVQQSALRQPAAASKAFTALAEYHAASPKVATLMALAGRVNATKFLEAVLEKNSDAKAKALACFNLGTSYHSLTVRQPEKAAELDKKAEAYLVRVEKEFGDVELTPKVGARAAVTAGESAKKILWEIRNLGIGKNVPEVVSKNLDDKEVKLSELKGKVVVLDFWATWCPPCKAMIPHSRKLVEKMKDKPFVLVSVSSDAKKETLTEFLEKEPMPWTHWWEGTREDSVGRKWNITGIPTLYVVDAKGVIRFKQVGFNSAEPDKVDKIVEKLLEEMEKK